MFDSGSSDKNRARSARRSTSLVSLLLAIELLDEMVGGACEAAWPLIRSDLTLTYAQIGILLGAPHLLAGLIEPLLGLCADTRWRRALIAGGGVLFAAGLLSAGLAHSYTVLLIAFMLSAPASGAFVGLSQASLMDSDPQRHAHLMARWTLAGSLGVVLGPLMLAAATWLGMSWRGVFGAFAVSMYALTVLAWRATPANHIGPVTLGLCETVRGALRAAARWEIWRWLILLMFSDFMLDLLLAFLALYMVDVAGATPAQAGMAVAVWSGVGLVGDALLIQLLEKVPGLSWLRCSAVVMALLYPAFLLAPSHAVRLILLALMGIFNSGWYAILKGQLYSCMPGRSGTVIALYSGFGIIGAMIPILLALIAQHAGLEVMMWALLLGPVAMLIGLSGTS